MQHIKTRVIQTLTDMIWPAILAYASAAFVIFIYGMIHAPILTLYIIGMLTTAELVFISMLDRHK